MSQPEQRRHPRAAKSFIVRYRVQNAKHSEWRMSPLKDLSRGGARFLSDREFSVGTVLEMELQLPRAPKPLGVSAKVIRVNILRENVFEHGVKFELTDDVISERIEQAVQHVLNRQGNAS